MNCCGHSYKTGEGDAGSERSCLLTHPGGLAEEHPVSCRENRARVSFLLGSSGVCVCLHAFGYVCVGGREVIRSDLLGFHFFFFHTLTSNRTQ